MENVINFIKKPVVWICGLVVLAIGGICAWLLNRK